MFESDRRCCICQEGNEQGVVLLCTLCAHPNRIRTFCLCCYGRLDLSLAEARRLFVLAGLTIDRTGLVFRFDGCPCCSHIFPPPTNFSVCQDSS